MHGAAIPKLAGVSDGIFIEACLKATDINHAGVLLDCGRTTIRHELIRRGFPKFTTFRRQHGIVSVHGDASLWTPAMVDRMRELHLAGLSAALIGQQIGMSRNAVIGKAHRLGIVLGIPKTKMPETKVRAPRPPSTLKGKPRPPRNVLPAVNALRGSHMPMILASGARQLAAARLAKETRAADRALIDAAIAEGKITKVPAGRAMGSMTSAWSMVAHS